MADYKGGKNNDKNLGNISDTLNAIRALRQPSGTGSKKQFQYTETEVLLGICAAGLFGIGNIKEESKFSSIIGAPNKSLLFNIKKDVGKIKSAIVNDNKQKLASTGATDISNQLNNNSILANIVLSINDSKNITELIDAITRLQDISIDSTNILSGVETISNIVDVINTIPTTKQNISADNINSLLDTFTKINFDKLNNNNNITDETRDNVASISSIINALSHIDTTNIKEIEDKDIEKINKALSLFNNNELYASLNRLSSKGGVFPKDQKNILDNIGAFEKIFEKINSLAAGKDNLKNVQGVGELLTSLSAVLSLGDKQVNIDTLNQIAYITQPGGVLDEIITNINLITTDVSTNAIDNINILHDYFELLSSVIDINFIDKIRIMTNTLFIRAFVNKTLPGLINDIDNKFSKAKLDDKSNTLDNLKDYFDTLKEIGSLSIKEQLSMMSSITLFKEVYVDNLAELIKKISDKFKDIDIPTGFNDLEKLFKILNSLNIDDSKIDDKQNVLYKLDKFLFGSSLAGKFGNAGRVIDKLNSKTSILGILQRLKEESGKFEEGVDNVKNLSKVLQEINKSILSSRIDSKIINNQAKALHILQKNVIGELIKLADIDDKKFKDAITKLSDITKDINTRFNGKRTLQDAISKLIIDKDTIKSIPEISNSIKKLIELATIIDKMPPMKRGGMNIFDKFITELGKSLEKLSKLDVNKVKAAVKIMESIERFIIISSAVLIISSMLMAKTPIDGVVKFILGISIMIGGMYLLLKTLNKKEFNNIDQTIKLINKLTLAIVILSLTAALCSRIAAKTNWKNILSFFGYLLIMVGMLAGITVLFGKLQKFIPKSIMIANEISLLVITCAVSLALATLLGSSIKPAAILAFGGAIGLLLLGIMVPLIFFKGVKIFMFKGIDDLGKLVLSCALTLALAGLVTKWLDMKSLFKFTSMLMMLVGGIVLSVGLFGKKEIQGAKDLGKLVKHSVAAMLIGGFLFMQFGDKFVNAIKQFRNTLFLFVAGITLVAGLAAGIGKEGIKHMKALSSIIFVSTAMLLLGGLLFMGAKGILFKKAVIEFGLTLFLFIGGISLVVGIASLIAKEETIGKMWMIALIVGVSALAMTLGPILLKKYDVTNKDLWSFLGVTLLFVAGIGAAIYLLGEINEQNLKRGILAMAGIAVLIFGLGRAMKELISVIQYKQENNLQWKDIWAGVGNMAGIMGAMGALVTGVGLLMTIPGAKFVAGAGGAVIAGIEALIYGMANCIKAIGESIKIMNELKGVKVSELLTPIKEFLTSTTGILTSISMKDSVKLSVVLKSVGEIGDVISKIGKGMQEYASLRVPESYDENGNVTAWRQLRDSDFISAKENITKIITSIGGAILGLFGIGPDAKGITPSQKEIAMEMLKTSGGLFKRETKFAEILKATTYIGDVIYKIASGIKEYATLSIPVYNADGTIKEYKQLDKKDFTKAGENIAIIITTIGRTLIDLYNGNIIGIDKRTAREMFSTSWGKESPFNKILNSSVKMGEMIKNISEGIKNYADLRIPDEFDENGNPKSYKQLNETTFTTAGESIAKIILAIGSAILEVGQGKDFKKIYKSKNIEAIITAISGVAEILSPLSNVLYMYGEGIFPIMTYTNGQINTTFEGATKITNWEQFTQRLTTSVSNILLGLGVAVDVALKNEHIKSLKGNKAKKLIKNICQVSQSLITVFNDLEQIMGKTIDTTKLTTLNTSLGSYITIINTLSNGIKDSHGKIKFTEKMFETYALINEFLSDFINIINNTTDTNFDIHTESVANSIIKVYENVEKIKSNDEFSKHVKTLKEYVNTINSINVSKLSSLVDLTTAISDLNSNFNSLDSQTDNFYEKFEGLINNLSDNINETKTTIENADKLHIKRKELIKNSITDITKLMDKEMIVKIKKDNNAEEGGQEGGEGSQGSGSGYRSPWAGGASNNPSSQYTGGNTDESNPVYATPWSNGGNSGAMDTGAEDNNSQINKIISLLTKLLTNQTNGNVTLSLDETRLRNLIIEAIKTSQQ